MRKFLCLLLLLSSGCHGTNAQGPGRSGRYPVGQTTADAVLAKARTTFPKFTLALDEVKANDPLIKQINFFRPGDGPGGRPDRGLDRGLDLGPAFASPAGVIDIDISYLEHQRPNFDDNRLVVVLFHELGHLHYFVTVPRAQWTSDNSEQAAFEYSLLRTKQLAEAGDCGPLATGVKFMKLRSEGTNLADPHVRALKRIVTEALYAGYVDYVKTQCSIAQEKTTAAPPSLQPLPQS